MKLSSAMQEWMQYENKLVLPCESEREREQLVDVRAKKKEKRADLIKFQKLSPYNFQSSDSDAEASKKNKKNKKLTK